jgi:hypothetical protein
VGPGSIVCDTSKLMGDVQSLASFTAAIIEGADGIESGAL